jgi:hypothetical protein
MLSSIDALDSRRKSANCQFEAFPSFGQCPPFNATVEKQNWGVKFGRFDEDVMMSVGGVRLAASGEDFDQKKVASMKVEGDVPDRFVCRRLAFAMDLLLMNDPYLVLTGRQNALLLTGIVLSAIKLSMAMMSMFTCLGKPPI